MATNATVVKVPPTENLMQMNKEALVQGLQSAIQKAGTYKAQMAAAAEDALEFVFAGLGAAVVAYWMGSIQREIDAGTEGYDEESLKIFGVDKDLAVGIALALGSRVKQLQKFKSPLRMSGMGALAWFAGRKAFARGLEGPLFDDEEEEDDETATA